MAKIEVYNGSGCLFSEFDLRDFALTRSGCNGVSTFLSVWTSLSDSFPPIQLPTCTSFRNNRNCGFDANRFSVRIAAAKHRRHLLQASKYLEQRLAANFRLVFSVTSIRFSDTHVMYTHVLNTGNATRLMQ